MTTVAMPGAFSMGAVISRLFAVLGRNLVTFLLLSVLLVGLPTTVVSVTELNWMSPFAMRGAGSTGARAVVNGMFSLLGVSLWLVSLLVTVIGNAVLQGAVIHASVTDLAGPKVSFGESLGVGFRFFLPLVGISIIVGIGCLFGFMIFIVPGVLLALAWCVAAPAEVMERAGVIGALGRSLELTRNHRGAIFGLMLAYLFVLWIVQMTLGAVAAVGVGSSIASMRALPGMVPQGMQTVMWVQMGLQLVINTLLASLSSVGIASIYFELRQAKEGIGVDQLAAVFD